MMKNVKFILLVFLLLAGIVACSDDENDPSTILIDKGQQTQTVYADEKEKTIQFTATEAWRTEIDYNAVKASTEAEPWIILDPASGEAGTVSVKLILSTNYSGSARKATIRIICGSTEIVITVEQRGTDENGEVPDEEEQPVPVPVQKVNQVIQYEDGVPFYVDFTYDAEGRIVSTHSYKMVNSIQKDVYREEFAYTDKQITMNFTGWDEGYVERGTTVYTLEGGRIIRGASENNESTYEESYRYDSDGRLIEYKENHPNNITYQQTCTWNGDLITSMVYTSGSNAIRYEYEYYDLSEVPVMPASFFLQWLPEELFGTEMAIYGWTGKQPVNFVKKAVVTGDEWNKENGTAVYRYETDSAGYITKVYRTWTPEGGTAEPEALYMEVLY